MWFDPDQLIICCDETKDDELIFRRAATRAGVASYIRFFSKGSEAYRFLKEQCIPRDDLPSLIFVRYQLEDCTGLQLLKFIRSLPRLQTVPVVLLTSPAIDGTLFSDPGAEPEGLIKYEKLVTPETFTEIEEILRHTARKES